jgi:hypothetical protein
VYQQCSLVVNHPVDHQLSLALNHLVYLVDSLLRNQHSQQDNLQDNLQVSQRNQLVLLQCNQQDSLPRNHLQHPLDNLRECLQPSLPLVVRCLNLLYVQHGLRSILQEFLVAYPVVLLAVHHPLLKKLT